MQNKNGMPPINDVQGWATFIQENPLPLDLQANPAVIYKVLKKTTTRHLIDAHIAFKKLPRAKEKQYIVRAIFFAISERVNRKLFKNFEYDRTDFINDMAGEFFAIADNKEHKDHESLRNFFHNFIYRRVINAINKNRRKNPILEDVDNLPTDQKSPNTSIKLSTTAPLGELLVIAKDSVNLMSPSVRKAYENALHGIEDDDNVTDRSKRRRRKKAFDIFKSEIEEGFMTAFDDDDDEDFDFTTPKLQDPLDVLLIAFHFACGDHPSKADEIRWCETFPRYADDIREFTEIALTLPAEGEGPELTSEDIVNLLEYFEKNIA